MVQSTIIKRMLEEDIFKTYIFLEEETKKGKSKGWIWENIYELEDLALIERITKDTKKIIHRKLFDEALLKDKYNLEFTNEDIEIITSIKKNELSIKDLEKVKKDLKN